MHVPILCVVPRSISMLISSSLALDDADALYRVEEENVLPQQVIAVEQPLEYKPERSELVALQSFSSNPLIDQLSTLA